MGVWRGVDGWSPSTSCCPVFVLLEEEAIAHRDTPIRTGSGERSGRHRTGMAHDQRWRHPRRGPWPTEQQRSAIVASGDLSQLQLFSKPDWGNKTPVRYYFGYSGQLVTPKSARVGGWSSSGTPALGDYAPLRT